jgi:hypothetical protein
LGLSYVEQFDAKQTWPVPAGHRYVSHRIEDGSASDKHRTDLHVALEGMAYCCGVLSHCSDSIFVGVAGMFMGKAGTWFADSKTTAKQICLRPVCGGIARFSSPSPVSNLSL